MLTVTCMLSTGCVRYEDGDERQSSNPSLSSLEDIKRQLDAPLRQPAREPTPEPEPESSGRWKAYGNRDKGKNPQQEQEKKLASEVLESQARNAWPPETGYEFPSMLFLNANGQRRSMEEFRGRMVLVEYVWMGSPVTQALSGSNQRGPFGKVPINKQFKSLEQYFPEYSGGVSINDVTLLQILMVDGASHEVTPETAKAWVKHFDLEAKRRTVLIGTPALLRNEGSQLLGGFQLLDRNLVVRVDATRERSKTLFSQLFPALPRIKNG